MFGMVFVQVGNDIRAHHNTTQSFEAPACGLHVM